MSDMEGARRRVLITGGASGFGLAIAEALLAQRARVAIGDIDFERLQEAAQHLGNTDDVLPLELDVTSPVSVQSVVEACQETFGGLDTLINSAGVIHFAPLAEIREAGLGPCGRCRSEGTVLVQPSSCTIVVRKWKTWAYHQHRFPMPQKIGCPMILFLLCSQVRCRRLNQGVGC